MCLKTNTDTGFEVKMMDVYNEFNGKTADKHKITKFRARVSSKLIGQKIGNG